jgi:nucleoside-diphosphate-sugar epimerase
MKRIAVIGAGGFVGARFVEFGTLSGEWEIVPIIRSFKSAARLARFGRCWRRADAADTRQLCGEITGCDAVVNLALGDFDSMASTAVSVWEACAAAGVPLLIHLSSGEVFGRAEDPAMNDDSPPLAGHWMEYARGKAAAELALRSRFDDASVSCIILRPGLIWGPRSPWVAGPAGQLVAGNAFLLGGGKGICNLIYLDNLMHSILGVVESARPASGCYNVGDDETVTWADYYHALAAQIGVDFSTVHQLSASKYRAGLGDRLDGLRSTQLGKQLKQSLSKAAKQRIKRALHLLRGTEPASGPVPSGQPQVTRGDWHLQNTQHKLPIAKFAAAFGPRNRYTFEAAMNLTGHWLRFAGYGNRWAPAEIASSAQAKS